MLVDGRLHHWVVVTGEGDLRTVFPQPLAEIESRILHEERWEGELTHTTRDGTRIVVASRWVLQRDKDGQPCGMKEMNNDITERRRVEKALLRSEKLASVGRMAATLAHEINNPLAAVTNLLFLAQLIENLPDSARKHLGTGRCRIEAGRPISRGNRWASIANPMNPRSFPSIRYWNPQLT